MLLKVLSTLFALLIILCHGYVRRVRRRSESPPPKGIIPLCSPQQLSTVPNNTIEFDIIAVHGLGAHSVYSWTQRVSKIEIERRLKGGFARKEAERVNWLQEFIPKNFPTSHPALFGHNADWFFMAPFKTSEESANNLLRDLKEARKDIKSGRPIIFIAHSFGGVIVKDALIISKVKRQYNEIFKATCGIIFLGTPHQGSSISWLGALLAQITTPFFGSNKMLLQSLQYHAHELENKQDLFSECCEEDLRLYCLYETLPTKLWGLSLGLVVDRASATLNGHEKLDLEKDHSGLNKFVEENDPAYLRICQAIQSILHAAEASSYLNDTKRKAMTEETIDTCHKYSNLVRESLRELVATRNEIHQTCSVQQRISWFRESHEYRTWSSLSATSFQCSPFLWYTGRPGTGKTDALIVIVEELLNTFQNSPTVDIVYFFCSLPAKAGARTGRPSTVAPEVLRSLIAQLIAYDQNRLYNLTSDDQERIRSVFNPVLDLSLKVFWKSIELLLRSQLERGVYIIIDGLEAIKPEEHRNLFAYELRRLLDSLMSEPNMNLKILVTSLPHAPMREAFTNLPFIDPFTEVMGCLELLKPLAQNSRQDHVVEAQKDTGDWINKEYFDWIQRNEKNILLLLGKPGSGKSTILLKLLKKTLDSHNLPHLAALLSQNPGTIKSSGPEVPAEIQGTMQETHAISKEKIIVTSFFYSFSGLSDKSHRQMLASVLFQILSQEERLFSLFRKTYVSVLERQQEGQRALEHDIYAHHWTFEELKNIFIELAKFSDFPLTIFIFVDAVDESEDTHLRDEILDLLTCANFQRSSKVTIKSAITSRHLKLPTKDIIDYPKIILDSHNGNDIEHVVDAGLRSIEDVIARLDESERSEYDLEKFRKEILSRTRGVFLWASLVLKLVENLIRDDLISPKEMMAKLDTLPDDLEKLYEVIVSRLKERDKSVVEKGKQWLRWVIFAERYLDTKEFGEAVAISRLDENSEITPETWKGQRMPTSNREMLQRALTSVCGGFLELRYIREISTTNPRIKLEVQSDNQSPNTTVQLLHWTVKNFLEKDKAHPFNSSMHHGDKQITNACIQYLKLSLLSRSIPTELNLENKRHGVKSWGQEEFSVYVRYLESHSLLQYALDFLPSHLERLEGDIGVEKHLISQIVEELGAEPKLPGLYVMMSWIKPVYEKFVLNTEVQISPTQHTSAGFVKNTSIMTEEQRKFSAKFLTAALVAAAMKGYMRAVRVLVKVGASASALDDIELTTALEAAARIGHSEIVNFFIQSNPDIQLTEAKTQQRAASIGSNQSFPPKSSWPERTPQTFDDPQSSLHSSGLNLALQSAAGRGHVTIVNSLLQKGASVDSKDELGRSPIHFAAAKGHSDVVRVLLSNGADPDLKENHGRTALWQAAFKGHRDVVSLLLREGADLESEDKTGITPLSIALSKGHEAVVSQLLDGGADGALLSMKSQCVFTVPFIRDVLFTGRNEELHQLSQILWEPKTHRNYHWAALVGLGGIGKTQIAIEFSYRCREIYPALSVFWITAGNFAQFEQGYHHIARRAQLRGWSDPTSNKLTLVSEWLSSSESGRWLMVLDNADDFHTFSPSQGESVLSYIPKTLTGRVLITSRNSALAGQLCGGQNNVMHIDPPPTIEARQLLQNGIGGTQVDELESTDLVEALECLPLAITQASAFIMANKITVRQYHELFKASELNAKELLSEEFMDSRRSQSSINSVSATWSLSFNVIQKQNPHAVSLLSLMSVLDSDQIPDYILREESQTEVQFTAAIGVLSAFFLISAHMGRESFTVHRLVQLSVVRWLESQNRRSFWKVEALRRVSAHFPSGNYETWDKCAQLLPHANAVLSYDYHDASQIVLHSTLLQNTGAYLNALGRYDSAYERVLSALEGFSRVLGEENLTTLACASLLVRVLKSMGSYGEAEQRSQRALASMEKMLGPEHPNTLNIMNDLASVLRNLGKYDEAEGMSRRALESMEKVLGPDHHYTLDAVNVLASVLRNLGKYDEADGMSRRALKSMEKVLGPDHPYTLDTVNDLVSVLLNLGKYDEAEVMSRRALASMEKMLGAEHPNTLEVMNNLALVLHNSGRYDEAEVMSRRALASMEKMLGAEHPNTLIVMNDLASVLRNLGKYDEAEVMSRRALASMEKVLGPDHPFTLGAVNDLVSVLLNLGKYDETEGMSRRALESMEKVLGPEHPYTLDTVNVLASVLRNLGKYDEAEGMSRRALESMEKVLGSDHPNSLNVMNDLASVLLNLGKYDEAEVMSRRALASMEKMLGAEHPNTLNVMNDLASVLRNLGKYDEAEVMSRRALASMEKVLGPEHPNTLNVMNDLASVLRYQSKEDEAEGLYQQVATGYKHTFGKENPRTIAANKNLADILRRHGRSL